MKKKEARVVEGLSTALGLDSDGSKVSVFEVLKAAAQALGCNVHDDGTVEIVVRAFHIYSCMYRISENSKICSSILQNDSSAEEEEGGESEPEDEPQRKRHKPADSEDSDSKEEESGDDEKDGSESDGGDGSEDEGASGSQGSDSDSEMEEDDEDDEPDTLFTQPVVVEDPRAPSDIDPQDYRDIQDPEELMQWLVGPVELSSFFESVLEQQPAVISRPNNRDYYAGLLSRKDIDALLRRKQGLQYTYNVDVTHYSRKGVRENFNFNGEAPPEDTTPEEAREIADADVVWRRVDQDGCSMRLLHPQRFSDPLWRLLSKLEDFWRSPLGSNSYLTPAGAQGFAPHFDDIDAFVLQLEGSKRWRLYAPTDARNVLPRYSSRDFTEEELGPEVLDVVLHPGDLLYMPRGQVHQAQSLPDSHSLHLTISANQQRTWQGLFESLIPRALTLAAGQYRQLRASVPRELAMAFGTAPIEDEISEEDREQARETVKEYAQACLAGVMESVDLDWGADQWDTEFLLQRLPPAPPMKDEKSNGEGGSGSRPPKLKPTSTVQMVHPGASRLMVDADGEEPMALVAHCMSNQREVHAATEEAASADKGIPSILEFPIGCAETLAGLLAAENEGVQLDEVPPPEEDAGVSVVEVAEALIKAGLLKITRKKN